MQKYRVYTDGQTHAECIVENCEAKVCNFLKTHIRTHVMLEAASRQPSAWSITTSWQI